MSGLVLLRPWWLLAIPLVLALGWLARRRARGLGAWDRAMDPHLMAALRAMGRVVPGRGGGALLPMLAAIATVIALTGPARQTREASGYRNLDAILLVVDISRSMTRDPAFEQAIVAARTVAAVAGTRQTGLIVHAGDAYLATAMTTDIRAVGNALALLDAETAPDAGSDPARALALAGEVIADAQIAFADVVLVTDGGGVDGAALAGATRLADRGIVLSVLHVPTAQGGRAGDAEALARAGEGIFATVANPFPIADALETRVASAIAETDYALILMRDYGRYLLLLALVPLLPTFRRAA